nr:gephyrin-like molybdotransferase Glp [Methylomonas sp. SURF-2]
MLTVAQAKQHIRLAIQEIAERESVAIGAALGRILADDLHSAVDIPPQRNAAMDGYAFSSRQLIADQAVELQEVGTAWAGKPYQGSIGPNQCVRIFTGAVVPESADSVIAQEQIQRVGNSIHFPPGTQPFKNIRAAGSDVKQGEVLVTAPKRLSPADLGLLAAAGISSVAVKRRLKIGFFSTGDELSALGNPLRTGQIYDSNRYMLSGLLNDANHICTDLGVIADDSELLEHTLLSAAEQFDVLISSGGASVGDADFVKQALEKCGRVNFWKLAIKPGKPLAFGRIKNCWFFGLPGNPIAVLVTYRQFVKPALAQLAGNTAEMPLQLKARCESALRKSPGREEYQRGILRQTAPGEFAVKSAGPQDSHQLKVASLANCFIVLDSACAGVSAGESVTVEPFDAFLSE